MKQNIQKILYIIILLFASSCISEEIKDESETEETISADESTENSSYDNSGVNLSLNIPDDEITSDSTVTEVKNQDEGIIEDDPSPSIYENAVYMMYNGRYEEAINLLKEYLQYHPESTEAMNAIGYSYYRGGDNTNAETWFKHSNETDSSNPEPYKYLGKIYTEANKYQSAIDMYSSLVEIEEENPEGYFGLGLVYNKVNMYEDSLNFMDTAIQYYLKNNSEETIEAYYLQGLNYYYTGQTEKAFSYLSAIEDYYLEDSELRMILIDIREQLKRKN